MRTLYGTLKEGENRRCIVCCQQTASLLAHGFACFRRISSRLQVLSLTSRCGLLVDPSALTMHRGRTIKTFPIMSSFQSLTYLLTPWNRVLLVKLSGSQLIKKFLSFYGTRRFITAFTNSRNLFISRASSIHSMPLPPTS
jgi:hypothetical protein